MVFPNQKNNIHRHQLFCSWSVLLQNQYIPSEDINTKLSNKIDLRGLLDMDEDDSQPHILNK